MYRLVEQGHVAGERYAQVGLRGYWPGEDEFAWQHERGITALRMRPHPLEFSLYYDV